ncbi:hypothetical protein KW445_06695 [Vibrio fluvialis]|nr:hypothetical protein [Vibrio fluvialis]
MSDYPDFFPEDIPPQDAIPTQGDAYRLVNCNPPSRDCFCSTIEEYPGRKAKRPTDTEMLYGASLFTEAAEATKKKQLFKPLRNKMLCAGRLIEEDGMMKKTGGPHHITVWFKNNADPHNRFTCIEE